MVLYCNFTALAFFGLIGFLNEAAKNLIYSYPPKCSQEEMGARISKATGKAEAIATTLEESKPQPPSPKPQASPNPKP